MSIIRLWQGLGVVPGKCAGVEAGFEPGLDDCEVGRDVEVPGYEQAVVADGFDEALWPSVDVPPGPIGWLR
jgi:hypothetical protein